MSVKKKTRKQTHTEKENIFVCAPRTCKYLSILHETSSCAFCISMWNEKYVTLFTKHFQ